MNNININKILIWTTFTIMVSALAYFGYKITKKALKMGKLVLKLAEKYSGEKEISGNKGFENKELEAKIKATGWKYGEPYCAYFVKAMYEEAHPEKKDILKRILTGGSQLTWSNAKNDKTGTVITTKTPSAGDIVIWQTYKNGVAESSGHAGIVKSASNDSFVTIEGNTGSNTGTREGDGIYEKTRNYTWNTANGLRLKGFIHLV